MAFPAWEKRNPTQEIAFPVRERQNPRRKSRFPCGKSKMPHRKSLFPCGKAKCRAGNRFSRVGKAKFHAGIPFTCVSALANTITIVGSSCLGRKFRLDEPQGKKNFRKRTLQDVVPAPPSVKDQAFDQQCIEEHHEWRRNDPAA